MLAALVLAKLSQYLWYLTSLRFHFHFVESLAALLLFVKLS